MKLAVNAIRNFSALQLKRIPVLRKLWLSEKDAGKDVTLKDGQEFDFEAAEKEDEEREERRQQREAEEGTDGRRRRYVFRA